MAYSIEYAALCHKGSVRTQNQDNLWCANVYLESENDGMPEMLTGTADVSTFPAFAIFDGLGGEQQGEMAAYLAAATFDALYNEKDKSDTKTFLTDACSVINSKICEYQREHLIRQMGTTAAVLMCGTGSLNICNIGDSRIYKFRGRKITQLSHDHVEASDFAGKSPLTQCLGIPETEFPIEPYIVEDVYKKSDIYLLCSDGITDMISDEELESVFQKRMSIQETVQTLMDIALKNGGVDNITVIVCQIGKKKRLSRNGSRLKNKGTIIDATMQTSCLKCGKGFSDNEAFCGLCGTKREAVAPEIKKTYCTECYSYVHPDEKLCPACGKSIDEAEGDEPQAYEPPPNEPQAEKKAKPFGKKLYIGIGIAAAVVVTAVIIVVLISLFSGQQGGIHIMYAKDSQLHFTSLSNPEPFEMTDRLFDNVNDAYRGYEFVWFSMYILICDNDRYIFYPDRIDGASITYYWRDLNADNSRADAAVRVDSDIRSMPFLTDDGSKMFYLKGEDNSLFVYDRRSGERTRIDDEVHRWYISDSGDYIVYEKFKNPEFDIYEMSLQESLNEKTRLDADSWIRMAYPNEKKVFYIKDEALYLKEAGRDSVRIANNVWSLTTINNGTSAYLLKANEVTKKLSEFVDDDLAHDSDLESLRMILDDIENAATYNEYDLYYWNRDGEVLIASNVALWHHEGVSFTTSSEVEAAVYQKYDASTGIRRKMSELIDEYWFDFNSLIWSLQDEIVLKRAAAEEVYITIGDKESILDCYGAAQITIDPNGYVYFLNGFNPDRERGTLMRVSISGGSAEQPEIIDDDVTRYLLGNGNGNAYYFKEVRDGVGDLYLSGELIAFDVLTYSLYSYEASDILIYYTDYRTNNNYGTLCVYRNGTQTKIADNVSFFVPINANNIAYLSDYSFTRERGDLMLYNGRESTLVSTGVAALLWNQRMMWEMYSFYYPHNIDH